FVRPVGHGVVVLVVVDMDHHAHGGLAASHQGLVVTAGQQVVAHVALHASQDALGVALGLINQILILTQIVAFLVRQAHPFLALLAGEYFVALEQVVLGVLQVVAPLAPGLAGAPVGRAVGG